jgi:hypothetical protein
VFEFFKAERFDADATRAELESKVTATHKQRAELLAAAVKAAAAADAASLADLASSAAIKGLAAVQAQIAGNGCGQQTGSTL